MLCLCSTNIITYKTSSSAITETEHGWLVLASLIVWLS